MRLRADVAPATCLLALLPLQLASYSTRREIPLPATPVGLLAADVDLDGRIDLVATSREPGRLELWHARERGILAAPEFVPVGDWPLAPVVFESGGMRIAVASRSARTLQSFRLGANDGGLVPAELMLELPGAPRAIAAASDEVALAFDGGLVWLVSADGSRRELQLTGKLPRCIALGRGGELVAGCQDTQEFEWLAPGKAARRCLLSGIPRAILELDPAREEWVLACGAQQLALLGANEGQPALRVQSELACGPIPIALGARRDSSGRTEELFSLAQRGNLLEHWQRDSAGVFARTRGEYAGQTPVALALGDFDRDGLEDAVVANQASRSLSWFAGRKGGEFARPQSVAVGRFPAEVASAELDGRAPREIVALNAKDGTLSVVGFDSKDPRELLRAPLGSNPRALACADFDADGRDEIACALQDGARTHLVLVSLSPEGALVDRLAGAAADLGPDVVALLPGPGEPRMLISADASSGEIIAWQVRRGAAGVLTLVPGARYALGSSPCALAWRAPGRLAVAASGPGPRRGVSLLALGPKGFELELWLPSQRSPRDLACTSAGLFVLETEPADPFQGCVRCARWSDTPAQLGPWIEARCGLTPRRLLALPGGALFVACQDSHVVNCWNCASDPASERFSLRREWDLGAGAGCLALAALELEGQPRLVVANSAGDELSVIDCAAASGR